MQKKDREAEEERNRLKEKCLEEVEQLKKEKMAEVDA